MVTVQSNEEMVSFDTDGTNATPLFGFNHDIMAKKGLYLALIAEFWPTQNFNTEIDEGVDANVNMINIGVANYLDEDNMRRSILIISGNNTMILPLTNDGTPEIVNVTPYSVSDETEIQHYLYERYGCTISFFSFRLRDGLLAVNIANAIWPGQTIDSKLDYVGHIEIERDGTKFQIRYVVGTSAAEVSVMGTDDCSSVLLGNFAPTVTDRRLDKLDSEVAINTEDISTLEDRVNQVVGITQSLYVAR